MTGPEGGSGDGERAIELLQQLGLKEYEARSYVALTGMPEGTARSVSEQADIPRTRVYDAMRVLESRGLVETQHSSPQQYRAVSIDEALRTLRLQYESRFDDLDDALREVESETQVSEQSTQEVWTINGQEAIRNRTLSVIDDAQREVVVLLADESVFSEGLTDTLVNASERGVDVFVGVLEQSIQDRVQAEIPEAEVFRSGLDWLRQHEADDETRIGRFLLVDRNILLMSSLGPHGSPSPESAVWASGMGNGLVVIARRLLQAGLNPGVTDSTVSER